LDLISFRIVCEPGTQRRSPVGPRKVDGNPGPPALLFQSIMQHRTPTSQLRDELKAFFGSVGVTVK
ncbi:MAG: hypothetical protein WA517_19545, partial [Candidatus Acidiferrum sp.]